MDVIVKARNCDVAARVKEEAVGRVEHATRFFDRLLGIEVIFSEETNPRIAERAQVEVTARTKGHHIRARGAASDHRSAVDAAVGRFERQLARYKARMVDQTRRAERIAVDLPAATEPPPEPRVVRTKRFALDPMAVDDAITHLELLDHEFYVFRNVATGECNVVYRRRDGDVGVIEAASDASVDAG